MPYRRFILILLVAACGLRAEGFFSQFWPEAEVFFKTGENHRLLFSYQQTRVDDENNTNDELGAYMDFFFAPLMLKKEREFKHPDAARNRFLTVRLGYLYDQTPPNVTKQYTAQTALIEVTPRYFLPKKILLTDENRGDFRFQNGAFEPRYRNRLRAERTFEVHKRAITPYVEAEAFYDTRYNAFYRLRYTLGSEFQVTKNLVLEGYYTRQKDSQAKFARANVIGLTVQFYFP